MHRYVCIHAHCYQPPRENPWLEEVEIQDSARPYHDWNERIAAECYEPNTASRILDGEGRITDIVDNYARISFNFGPTLFSWMERRRPEVHQAIVEADRRSRERFSGHGSALAQVYNHMIMPLANARDRSTQVLWGLADFRHRFGRDAEGMWLPETATDLPTLDVLAEQGLRFTVLAPRQARRVRSLEKGEWCDVGEAIDPRVPYLCRLPSGRTITLFFYDGPVAQDVAFGRLLEDGGAFAQRLAGAFDPGSPGPQLVHVATDGESYGHHHRDGDMALAYCLHRLESEGMAELTVYGEFLERHPPEQEVEIHERSSWSCVHGVERWQADCGCNSGGKPGWSQAWRAPLRQALDELRDALAPAYEQAMAPLAVDPWRARDEYVQVLLDRDEENVRGFLRRQAGRELSGDEAVRALKLLELQRHAQLMYTSCGWFFDEISGIETMQVLRYAARAVQLGREVCGLDAEPALVRKLAEAPSNLPEIGSGGTAFDRYVRPAAVDLLRVGSHYAISSLFEDYPETTALYSYTARSDVYDRERAGRHQLAVGKARVRSEVTWDDLEISFAVLHLGDHNVMGGVREFQDEEAFEALRREVREPFLRSDVPEAIRVVDRHFGTHTYSLWHLFRDEQRKVLDQIRYTTLEEVEGALRQIYQNNYSIMTFLHGLQIPLPKAFRVAAEYIVDADLKALFRERNVDVTRLESLLEEVNRWPLEIEGTEVGHAASSWLDERLDECSGQPGDRGPLELADQVLALLVTTPVQLDLRRAQNRYFALARRHAPSGNAAQDPEWAELFSRLGRHLGVRIAP